MTGLYYIGILLCVEILAIVVGTVGVIHLRDIGGRVAGFCYGLAAIVIGVTPAHLLYLWTDWSWWYAIGAVPLALGCMAICLGLREE